MSGYITPYFGWTATGLKKVERQLNGPMQYVRADDYDRLALAFAKLQEASVEAKTDAKPYGYLWFDKAMERRFTHRLPNQRDGAIGDVVAVYTIAPSAGGPTRLAERVTEFVRRAINDRWMKDFGPVWGERQEAMYADVREAVSKALAVTPSATEPKEQLLQRFETWWGLFGIPMFCDDKMKKHAAWTAWQVAHLGN